MAAIPPQRPGPVQENLVSYQNYFADAQNDPFNGDYTQALLPYAVPAANAMTPAAVNTLAINCRNQNVPTAFVLLHSDDLKLHLYLQLDKFDARFGFPASPFDDRLFIGKGELHHNHHQLVEWQVQYFHQTNNIRVPSHAFIDNALAGDNDIEFLGPYQDADADTETIRVRNTCYIPPAYVPLFLAHPLSPRQAWETVQTQIVVDNRQESCAPLINFLRAAITISQAGNTPIINQLPPYGPIAPPYLLDRRRAILERDFPSLNHNVTQLQQTQIAGQLGLLVNETRATREAETQRKQAERNKTPDQFLGPAGLTRLLRYCQIGNMEQLPAFWAAVSRSPKAQQLSILQWEINRVKLDLNEPDLPFIASASLWETIKSLQWEMTTNDAVNTGLNPFLLGDHDVTDALNQQSVYEMMHGDGASPSLHEAAALVRAKAGAPKLIFNARQQLKRFEIINHIIMGTNHPFCLALQILTNRMISSEHMLHQLHQQHLLLPTLLCKKVAIQASNWYKNQSCSPTPYPSPTFQQIFTDIEEDNHWIPSTPPSFLHLLGLSYFQAPGPAPTLPPPTRNGQGTSTGNNDAPQDQRTNNLAFNSTLFQTYKEAPVTCRTVRLKIRNNELPALPISKIDGEPMCLAWHIKATCNVSCGRKADHVPYTTEEYTPLVTWCTDNFPTG
jgi:hypothetical protein